MRTVAAPVSGDRLERAAARLPAVDERVLLHLALPVDAVVGLHARSVRGGWEFRGGYAAFGADAAAVALLAALTHRDGDRYLDLDAEPDEWVKVLRSGVHHYQFGPELHTGGRPRQLGNPGPAVGGNRTAASAASGVPDAAAGTQTDPSPLPADVPMLLRQLTGYAPVSVTAASGGGICRLDAGSAVLEVPYQAHGGAVLIGVPAAEVLRTRDRRPIPDGWCHAGISRLDGRPVLLHAAGGVRAYRAV